MDVGFVWTKFGVMAAPAEDGRYIYAMNTAGEARKLSKYKYPNHQELKRKCISLIGYPTVIRTSQNTANWSANEWFSDISLDDQHSERLPKSGSDQTTESYDDLMQKVNQMGQQLSSINDKWEQRDSQLKNEIINAKDQEIDALKAQLETERAKQREQRAEANAKIANQQADEAISIAKNANNRTEQFRDENERLKSEKQALIDAIQNERARLSAREQKNINEDNEKLKKMPGLVGHEHSIKVVGHPKRTLALRAGVSLSERNRLKVKIIEQTDENCYRAELLEHNNQSVIVALGLDNRNGLYAATFKNIDSKWFDAEERVAGLNESILKNRLDITDEELITHHVNVNAELYRMKSEGF